MACDGLVLPNDAVVQRVPPSSSAFALVARHLLHRDRPSTRTRCAGYPPPSPRARPRRRPPPPPPCSAPCSLSMMAVIWAFSSISLVSSRSPA